MLRLFSMKVNLLSSGRTEQGLTTPPGNNFRLPRLKTRVYNRTYKFYLIVWKRVLGNMPQQVIMSVVSLVRFILRVVC